MTSNLKPFLRWAGGKQKIAKKLLKYLPCDEFDTYWEPFLGSGALFFAIQPKKAVLTDENFALINCFLDVRDHPTLIFKYIYDHLSNSTQEYYYKIRTIYNNSKPSIAQSARFIYLNRICLNGIYRVNKNGQFNVPYGFREPPPPLKKEQIIESSLLLQNVKIEKGNYCDILTQNEIKSGDFIYLDPPYPHYNGNGTSFNHYTDKRFTWIDHNNLAIIVNELNKKNCRFMLSYLDDPSIRSLYHNYYINSLPVLRYISSNGIRKWVPEIVITNYKVV